MVSRELRQVRTVEVPAVSRFVAADCFKEHVRRKPLAERAEGDPWSEDGPIVCELNEAFRQHLLGKIEENVPAATLIAHAHSKKAMSDSDIVMALAERAETFLAHLYDLLSRQPHGEGTGEPGALSGKPESAFFIRGTDGNLWVVTVRFGYNVIEGSGPDAAEGHAQDEWWAWAVSAAPIRSDWARHQRLVFSR